MLLLSAVACFQLLIECTTAPASEARFDKLCDLLTKAVIGGAWSYGGESAETMEASIRVLPSLLRALGLGSARYLKVRHHSVLATEKFVPLTAHFDRLSYHN